MSHQFPASAALGLLMCSRLACAQSLLGFPDSSFNDLGFAQGPFLGETERFNGSAELVDAQRLSTLQARETPCADRSRHPLRAQHGSKPESAVRGG